MFNLSCEFAGASAIIYHFTNNPIFTVANEVEAEKTLIAQIGTSNNPNIGIRMGQTQPEDMITLYNNLNKNFGGADYYGVHAPPFIDVFTSYNLAVKPIVRSAASIEKIKNALYARHLLMAWIQLGYGKIIDQQFGYGAASIVKGEHSIVITGYNEQGVFVMDPALAATRHIMFSDLLAAMQAFPVPILEVYPSTGTDVLHSSFDPTFRIDALTGLDRSVLKIIVQNAHAGIGAGSTLAGILTDFGYSVVGVHNATGIRDNVSISIKPSVSDYTPLLKRDLSLASYNIASVAADLSKDSPYDVVITIGQ